MSDQEKMLDNLMGKVASSKEVEKDLRRQLASLPGHYTTSGMDGCHGYIDVLAELESQQGMTFRLQTQVDLFKSIMEQS